MIKNNPFEVCPEYETKNYLITKIKIEDAEDLFEVYSDSTTRKHMNNDNCGGEWPCSSLEVVQRGIKSWENEYDDKYYIRWTITQKSNLKSIGTMELAPAPGRLRFFDGVCNTGILRLDIKSELETTEVFSEIYSMTNIEMIDYFGIEKIITKGNPEEVERVKGLEMSKYKRLPDNKIIPFSNYYISGKW